MRMTITNIEYENSRVYVIGDTSIGNLKGEWCDKKIPILGETYFFELSIDDLDKKEILVIDNKQFCSSVNFSDNQVQFKGICEEIDDVYVIRFCDDWIEMIAIENDDFSIKKGDAVAFSISYNCIGIYPYEVGCKAGMVEYSHKA